jgi:hypothetical protein
MLEILKAQYQSANTLSKSNFYNAHNPEMSQIFSELYPQCLEYFHELNPGFLFKISKAEYLAQFQAMTVRDGALGFGSFILKNFQILPSLKTHFFIDRHLTSLVPNNLRQQFSCWQIVQKKKVEISKAKRIVITGLMNEQSLPSLEAIKKSVETLTDVNPSAEVEVFLPIRNNPFGPLWKESFIGYQIIEVIKNVLPNHKLTFLGHSDLFEHSSLQNAYCLDLMTSRLTISDKYLNHYMASRGGSISTFNDEERQDHVFEIDLSFNHKVQFFPLPISESLFPEMIFYKKQASTRDYAGDPIFHNLLRNNNF